MTTPKHQILVPVDGSDHSMRAAQFAALISHAMDARMTILYVFPLPSRGLKDEEIASFQTRSKDASAEFFGRVSEVLKAGGVDHGFRSESGNPAMVIAQIAEEINVDQIVMGSRGLGEIRGLLIGSISQKVMRLASCPVTIVH